MYISFSAFQFFFFSIFLKSSHAITSDVNVAQMARAAEFFLSDGIILTGTETGDPPNVENLKGKFYVC